MPKKQPIAPAPVANAASARAAKPRTTRVTTTRVSKAKHSKAQASEPTTAESTAAESAAENTAVTLAVAEAVTSVAPAEDPREAIAKLAYKYWEQRGYQHGNAHEDWIRAEAEFLSRSTAK